MDADLELESWRRDWQSASPLPPDLKARVERETRWMRRVLAAEVLITIGFGGASLAWAALSRRADALVLAIGVWVFIAMAWGVSFLLRRDAWAPATVSTAAFLELSILRCRRRRDAIVAQSILYALILTFDLSWIYLGRPELARHGVGPFLTSTGVGWVWGVSAALGVAAVTQRRRLGRELERLTNLRQQLTDDPTHSSAEGTGTWHSAIKSVKRFGKKKWRGGASAKS
jgi:hypothetical protein